jgi:hypothetical protein
MSTIIDVNASPSINVYIKSFIKQINIPVIFEIISNKMSGGGITNYFQSFLQLFSQEKQQQQQEKTYLNKLFYSGESLKKKEEIPPPPEENNINMETMTEDYKIKLTTPKNPDIDLQKALKGTKFDYFLERNQNKLNILWI